MNSCLRPENEKYTTRKKNYMTQDEKQTNKTSGNKTVFYVAIKLMKQKFYINKYIK